MERWKRSRVNSVRASLTWIRNFRTKDFTAELCERRIGNNDLNHRILLFSASFHCEPLKVAQYEQNKNLFLSCPAQFSRISLQIFRSYGISFLAFSFFCCLETCRSPREILRPQQIFRRTGEPGSFSKVWKKRNCDVLFQYNIVSRVTYEKYANLR